jgi:hypothetical protein
MTEKPIVEEIWVVSNSGITLFNQNTDVAVDRQIFGAFLYSITQFASNLTNNDLKCLDMGDNRITFCRCTETGILIVCKSSNKIKKASIFEYMEKIRKSIITNVGKELSLWNGDESIGESISKCVNLLSDKDNWLGVSLTKEISKNVLSQL